MNRSRIISFLLMLIVIFSLSANTFPVLAIYENTYTNTGNGQKDIAAVAKTQVGYYEGIEKYTGYTKYGDWYRTYMKTDSSFITAPWCAMFVSWCSFKAGTIDVTGSFAYCPYWVSDFKNKGKWQSRASGYIPVEGDIIFFSDDGTTATHVGVVYSSNKNTVYTVEGNTSDSCKYRSYSLSDTYILGYGTPLYKGRVYNVPSAPVPVTGERVYITGYNEKMNWGSANIFDKNFNSTNTATFDELGIRWSAYLVAALTTEKNVYKITLVGEHLDKGSLVIPEGGIIFASHCDDRDTNSDAYKNSRANKIATVGFRPGDNVALKGVDLTTGAITGDASIEKVTIEPENKLKLKSGTYLAVDFEKEFLIGVKAGDTESIIRSQFYNTNIRFDKAQLATGDKVYLLDSNGAVLDKLTIVISGDVNCDGKVSSIDYLLVKRAFLRTITLSDYQNRAACVSGGATVTSSDYLKVKRHFLSTYNLYK